ncbi:uncharacterized protein LOC129909167 isoform X2 [Episyrphus balteatus]|uniref:uncharacterized protein LOC129909167 isoform X2 n=1 Tax=Episyrphus balteatus TaxID=286459 RepID=UPI002484E495|nr:uncharacterized protein LOC129909167 isoform X2 [Episyrphus balteatus]
MNEHGLWIESGCRSRNILTLEERVKAIREFDRTPVYQRVADLMNCSAKQIRNIVMNRESILLYYASKTGECQGGFSKHNDRQEKLELLNRVMFEWIQRSQAREDIGRISTKLIRTIALDVKNQLKVPRFYPNGMWLETFMAQYDITEDDLLCQNVYNRSKEPKEGLSLKISDIVDDVNNMVGETEYKLYKKEPKEASSYSGMNVAVDNSSMLFENSNSETGDDYDEVRVVIEEDDGEDEEYDYMVPAAKIRKVETTSNSKSNNERTIDTYEDALRHLKPLEDFVLLEENFRAIGVISQLESIFRNPSRFQE